MFKVECAKCGGKGEIPAYRTIAGGTCFACNGIGHMMQKTTPKRSTKFAVSAISKETGERHNVFMVNAQNSAKALDKAIVQLSRGNGYIAASAAVEAA